MSDFIKEYFKQAFRWQKGRQGTGYDKMLILHSFIPIPFDIYIIRYYVGSFIPPHTFYGLRFFIFFISNISSIALNNNALP